MKDRFGLSWQIVLAAAADAIVATGDEGTSVDDLVAATGLFRGSLCKAFGSKRGLFLTALRRAAERPRLVDGDVDLLLDVAPTDPTVREVCRVMLTRLPGRNPARALGVRLIDRSGLGPEGTGG